MKINDRYIIKISGLAALLVMLIMNIYIAVHHYHLSTIKLSSFYFHQSDKYDLCSPLKERIKICVAGNYEIDNSRVTGQKAVVYKRLKIIQYIDAK